MNRTAYDGPEPPFGPVSCLPPVPPALPRKHGVRGTVFTVLVWVALLAGAVVMGLVLLLSGRPEAIAIGMVLAVLPVGPLVACYLWLDRYEPEPCACSCSRSPGEPWSRPPSRWSSRASSSGSTAPTSPGPRWSSRR